MDNISVLIKYDYTGETLKKNEKTVVLFDYNKCLNVDYLGSEDNTKFIEAIHDKPIIMKFMGKTRDRMHVFIIDKVKVIRNQKLNIILE